MVPSQGSITVWLGDLSSPDPGVRDEAAWRIWDSYAARLLGLVRQRLDRRLRARVDAEDVLQSAYKSFCEHQGREGTPPLASRDDLWRLLARIAVRKVCNAISHHRAGRRDYRREAPPAAGQGPDGALPFPAWAAEHLALAEPGPGEVLELAELLEGLPEDLRPVALWKLEERTTREIAALLGRTTRSVELKVSRLRALLERDEAG